MQTLRRRFTLAALGLAALPAALLPARALANPGPGTAPAATVASTTAPAPATGSFAQHPAALAFARQLDAEQGWSEGWAERWIGHQARHRPQIVRLMTPMPRGTLRDWPAYRARFVEPVRIQAGLRFWQQHAASLERAEREFGVPDWLIVGIIGVETLYGRHMGTHRVLDALATLAFDFPPEHPRAAQRSEFFRSELAAFLRLSHQHPRAPDGWRGSFAGAIGLPQFMPSNWPRFGVDFDADGRIEAERKVGGHAGLPAVLAQEAPHRADGVGNAVDQVDAAVGVEIDSKARPVAGHELRQPDGPGKAAAPAVGGARVLVAKAQKGRQFGAEKLAALGRARVLGREVKAQRGQRVEHTVRAHVAAVERLDTDDAHDEPVGHAKLALGALQAGLVLLPKAQPGLDAHRLHEARPVGRPVAQGAARHGGHEAHDLRPVPGFLPDPALGPAFAPALLGVELARKGQRGGVLSEAAGGRVGQRGSGECGGSQGSQRQTAA